MQEWLDLLKTIMSIAAVISWPLLWRVLKNKNTLLKIAKVLIESIDQVDNNDVKKTVKMNAELEDVQEHLHPMVEKITRKIKRK